MICRDSLNAADAKTQCVSQHITKSANCDAEVARDTWRFGRAPLLTSVGGLPISGARISAGLSLPGTFHTVLGGALPPKSNFRIDPAVRGLFVMLAS
jgi:hypothetical protein